MKKIFSILLIAPTLSFANEDVNLGNDYSTGNSNPLVVTIYKPNDNKTLLPNINRQNTSFYRKRGYSNLITYSEQIKGCWDGAGKKYNIDPWLLMAYAKTESSFNPKAINKNKNKSEDIGFMQINSIWYPVLAKHNITKEDLFHPCTSIYVGAWIASDNIKKFGFNIDGIGAYNSPSNVKIRREYGKKVINNYNKIVKDLYYAK